MNWAQLMLVQPASGRCRSGLDGGGRELRDAVGADLPSFSDLRSDCDWSTQHH